MCARRYWSAVAGGDCGKTHGPIHCLIALGIPQQPAQPGHPANHAHQIVNDKRDCSLSPLFSSAGLPAPCLRRTRWRPLLPGQVGNGGRDCVAAYAHGRSHERTSAAPDQTSRHCPDAPPSARPRPCRPISPAGSPLQQRRPCSQGVVLCRFDGRDPGRVPPGRSRSSSNGIIGRQLKLAEHPTSTELRILYPARLWPARPPASNSFVTGSSSGEGDGASPPKVRQSR
jgi:hypothetical protein